MSEEESRGPPPWLTREIKENTQKIKQLSEVVQWCRSKIQFLENQIAKKVIPPPVDFQELKDRFERLENALVAMGTIITQIVSTPEAEKTISQVEHEVKAIIQWFGDTTAHVPKSFYTPKPSELRPTRKTKPTESELQEEAGVVENRSNKYRKTSRQKEISSEDLDKMVGL
jgi:hypothetical protein